MSAPGRPLYRLMDVRASGEEREVAAFVDVYEALLAASALLSAGATHARVGVVETVDPLLNDPR